MAYGITLAVIGTVAAAVIFGSIALQYITPSGDGVITPLEQRCTDVARQGHAIHSAYPGLTLDEMPVDDVRAMLKLDEAWMDECVAKLPPSVIIEIADRVSREASMHGE